MCWLQDIFWISFPNTSDTSLTTKIAKPLINAIMAILFGVLYYNKFKNVNEIFYEKLVKNIMTHEKKLMFE